MAVPRLALGEDLARGHVQGGEQGGGAVAGIAVRDAFDVSEPEGQQRLGSLQRLDLALLVHAEHHRALRRVEVESDDVVDLLGEERIGGELEVLLPVRLDVERSPEPVDRGLGDPRGFRHGPAAPVRAAVGRPGLDRPPQHDHEFVVFDGARPSRLAFVVQPHEALGSEALAPLADRLAAGADPFGDRLVVQAVGAQKHDLGTAHEPGGQAARADQRLKFLAGTLADFKRFQRTSPGHGFSPLVFGWMERTIPGSRHYVKIITGHNTSRLRIFRSPYSHVTPPSKGGAAHNRLTCSWSMVSGASAGVGAAEAAQAARRGLDDPGG